MVTLDLHFFNILLQLSFPSNYSLTCFINHVPVFCSQADFLFFKSGLFINFLQVNHGLIVPQRGGMSGAALPSGQLSLQLCQWAGRAGIGWVQRCELTLRWLWALWKCFSCATFSLALFESCKKTFFCIIGSSALLQLNPNVNAFQRKFVGEVRRCEELEKTFSKYLLIFSKHYLPLCCFWPFLLPFSILGAEDQSFPYATAAWSPPPSTPNAFGPSASWTYYHRGGEWEAGQRAQRGGQADNSISLLHHLYMVQIGCKKYFTPRAFARLTSGIPESWQSAGSIDPALSVPGCSDEDALYHSITGTSKLFIGLHYFCKCAG